MATRAMRLHSRYQSQVVWGIPVDRSLWSGEFLSTDLRSLPVSRSGRPPPSPAMHGVFRHALRFSVVGTRLGVYAAAGRRTSSALPSPPSALRSQSLALPSPQPVPCSKIAGGIAATAVRTVVALTLRPPTLAAALPRERFVAGTFPSRRARRRRSTGARFQSDCLSRWLADPEERTISRHPVLKLTFIPHQNCEKNFQIAAGSSDHCVCPPGNRHQMLGTTQPWYWTQPLGDTGCV
jgi:hypothetical protein